MKTASQGMKRSRAGNGAHSAQFARAALDALEHPLRSAGKVEARLAKEARPAARKVMGAVKRRPGVAVAAGLFGLGIVYFAARVMRAR
ncbi:hypothetical protein [Cognatilysobacter lacus]|uniref:DUF3618 domain-containing protein n=1 Tax=Cognatilysobacter lacus TaxID=1643323 RepID=A0A5D8ZBF1_9GAMM|nr:hypothetical protein [Lysobacter lacus]TZF90014.1 hypothetical protein FW784_07035 [Lysobacter lacus]